MYTTMATYKAQPKTTGEYPIKLQNNLLESYSSKNIRGTPWDETFSMLSILKI